MPRARQHKCPTPLLLLLVATLCHALPSEVDFFNRLSARDETCQTSLDGYVRLHRQISQGALPPRFVHVQCGSGLADTLKGLVSAFLYALLSGRALKLANPAMGAAYSSELDLFSPPFVSGDFSSVPYGQSAVFYATGWPHPLQSSPYFQGFAYGENMSEVYGDRAHVFLETGFLMPLNRLLNDETSVHAGDLRRMGFTVENIFRCSLNFLMRPRREIFDAHKPMFREHLGKAEPARLFGVHIRLGDVVFSSGSSIPVQNLNTFTKYIRSVEFRDTWVGRGAGAVYKGASAVYVASDSLKARRYMRATLGMTAVINDRADPQHISKNLRNERQKAQAMRLAVSELMLLSASDTLLLSHGNFGLTAALLARKRVQVHKCMGALKRWPWLMKKVVEWYTQNLTISREHLKCQRINVGLQSVISPEVAWVSAPPK